MGRTSAFARISQPVAIDRERMRTSFVFPIRPSTPSTMSSVREISSLPSIRLGRVRVLRKYVADVPNATPSDNKSNALGRDENDMIEKVPARRSPSIDGTYLFFLKRIYHARDSRELFASRAAILPLVQIFVHQTKGERRMSFTSLPIHRISLNPTAPFLYLATSNCVHKYNLKSSSVEATFTSPNAESYAQFLETTSEWLFITGGEKLLRVLNAYTLESVAELYVYPRNSDVVQLFVETCECDCL